MIVSRRTVLGLMPVIPSVIRGAAQAPVVTGLRRFASAGNACFVLEPDGRVKAWGFGVEVPGVELGLASDRPVAPYVAQEVPALRGAIALAAGRPSYALMSDGRVLMWSTRPPAPVPNLPSIASLASLGPHVIALTTDGTVITASGAQFSQLGVDHVRVAELSTVAAVSAGSSYFLALLKDGSVRAWGDNRWGQLGDGSVEDRERPVAVRGITNAIAVAACGEFSAALLADGTVMTWGAGYPGLGRIAPNVEGPNPIAAPVPDVTGITAIALGAGHVLALHRSGGVVSWGFENVAHPVGHPGIPAATPAAVPFIKTARAVFAGALSSQVLLADGTFMVWGAIPSLSFRVDGADPYHASFPVPMVVKGL